MVGSHSLDGRSTVSLRGLSLNELDDFAGALEDIARLQVVGMAGTVRMCLADSDEVILQSYGYLRLAKVGLSSTGFLCLSRGVSGFFLEEEWRFLNLQS